MTVADRRGWLIDEPAGPPAATIVLAHGTGAAMDTAFMTAMAGRLAAAGHRVVRFEFAYMARRRADGKRRPPERAAALLEQWDGVVAALAGTAKLVIGGKSMGGRIASMLAARDGAAGAIAGVVCLGYPFHPPRRPDSLRIDHLRDIAVPTLIVQGTRDAFGTADEVAGYPLAPAVSLVWLDDGDHSLVPRQRSGTTLDAHLDAAAVAIDRFVTRL